MKKRIAEKYHCRFLENETAVDDSDDGSDKEDIIKNIEDEEKSRDSFINDSSQLGFTQDGLPSAHQLECNNQTINDVAVARGKKSRQLCEATAARKKIK